MTASAFEENKALAIESGCNNFVRKPFREADIINMMTKHIGVHFVYKEDDKQNQFPAITEQLSIGELHSKMAELPAELREKLIAATNSCDADRIDRIIGDIGLLNNQLGDALKHLSEKFAYNEILDLIEKDIKNENEYSTNRHHSGNGVMLQHLFAFTVRQKIP